MDDVKQVTTGKSKVTFEQNTKNKVTFEIKK